MDVPQELYGLNYLRKVAENIWKTLEFKYIFFGYALKPDYLKVQTVVLMAEGQLIDNFIYDLEGTPCQNVFSGKRVCIHSHGVARKFPQDEMLVKMGVESYIGSATVVEGKLFGLVAILDNEKIIDEGFYASLLEFIAARVSVELERYTHKHQLDILRKKANIDSLTKCLNRNSFDEAISNIFFEYKNASIMFVDADLFKIINDTHGHQYGDKVLKFIASTLMQSVRGSDLVCRFGGEEFIVYLPNVTVDEAKKLGQRIHDTLLSNTDFNVTVSIGITNCVGNDEVDDAVYRADKAVYQAKNNGRNRTEVILNTQM